MRRISWKSLNACVCPWWLIRTFDNPLRHLVHDPVRILSGLVAPGQLVADIGCGIGYFTIPLARLVGPEGLVLAFDLQERMLAGVKMRAVKAGVMERIRLCRSTPTELGLEGPVDFVLTFYMVHEVQDQERFLRQIHASLTPGGTWLLAEPRLHVTAAMFERTVATAGAVGFTPLSQPHVSLSRTILFQA
jgi:ubiquinone/menaquinone biosynthesis C-methylase UbiE